MANLTKRAVDGAKPGPHDVFVWDDELPGFGLRVKPSGVRAFIIQYRNRNGRSRRMTVGRYGRMTPDEARKAARRLLAAVDDGADPAETRAAERAAMTVAQLCDEYLAKAKAGHIITRRGRIKKASTLYTDAGRIERHIKPLLGRRTVNDLTKVDILGFRRDVIAGKTAASVKTGKRGRAIVRGGRGAAARTLGLLGAILAYALGEGYRAANPVSGVTRPADGKRQVRLSREQYRALGKALEAAETRGEPWQAIMAIRLLALTGCRRGEIEGLRRGEVDNDCLRLGDSKTGESARPLGNDAARLLRGALKRAAGGEHVLPGLRHSGSYRGLPKAWGRIVKGEGLEGLSPHSLRHAFASTAEDLGYTVPTIAALLGHAGHGVTRGYIHKADSALVAAADRVARAIDRAMRGEHGGVVVPLLSLKGRGEHG